MDTPTFIVFLILCEEVITRGFLVRLVIRESMRFLIILEVWAQKIVQLVSPPRYVLTGRCHQRGVCCKQIIGNPPGFMKKDPWVRWFAGYHRFAHNFEPIARGPNGEVIFSCNHLQDDGRCGIYRYRPFLCRNYPLIPFFERPRTLPGCGFVAVPRVVSKMKSRLPVLNAHVAAHHPTPPHNDETGEFEDFHLVEKPEET